MLVFRRFRFSRKKNKKNFIFLFETRKGVVYLHPLWETEWY